MDLTSILLVLYAVAGDVHESEIPMQHTVCMQAAAKLQSLAPSDMPMVELLSGDRVPVLDVQCLAACPLDIMADDAELRLLSERRPG